jgi:DNA-binding response OmpR family regulator
MCSAFSSEENIVKAYESGMDDVIFKPVRRLNL